MFLTIVFCGLLVLSLTSGVVSLKSGRLCKIDFKLDLAGCLNDPPYKPSNPNPPNGSTNVDINTILSWTGGDPDGDPVVYDVYFGTNPNPPQVSTHQTENTYNPGRLQYNTKYYWRIDAFDGYSYTVTGDVWTFTTEISTNNPPNKPSRPSGPTSGKVSVLYSYSSSTIDPNGDQIYYWFDWGDGTNTGWLGPYESGETVSASHSWNEKGSYQIKVKAKDIQGAESEWSDPLPITMPKSMIFIEPQLSIIKYFLKIFPKVFLS